MNEAGEKRLARVQQDAKLGLERRLQEKEYEIITRMVQEYRGGKMDINKFIGGIGAISELRALATSSAHDKMRAENDMEKLSRS